MKRLRQWLVQHLVKKLLVAVTEEDVLIISGKDWLYKKRKLSREEMLMLKDEAKSFQSSLLYELIKSEVVWHANKQMLEDARTIDDILFGKAMLHDMNIIKKFITNVQSL